MGRPVAAEGQRTTELCETPAQTVAALHTDALIAVLGAYTARLVHVCTIPSQAEAQHSQFRNSPAAVAVAVGQRHERAVNVLGNFHATESRPKGV